MWLQWNVDLLNVGECISDTGLSGNSNSFPNIPGASGIISKSLVKDRYWNSPKVSNSELLNCSKNIMVFGGTHLLEMFF